MLEKLDKMEGDKILEVNEEIIRTNELPEQFRNESPTEEYKKND